MNMSIVLRMLFLMFGWVGEIHGQNVFSNRHWTWISGSNVAGAAGSYGTLRVESSSNIPPSRFAHSMVYHNFTNSIYIMHGISNSATRYSDVWRYNLTSNLWTWIGGSTGLNNVATYGTKGVAASTNVPGSRDSTALVCDANGFLYTFGGYGYDTTGGGYLNDLWRYDVSSNWFTWLAGSNTRNQLGTYGTKGVEASSNSPGARGSFTLVFHPRTNSIYIYGGTGYDNASQGPLGDLWRYSITSGMWTWLTGASTINQHAVFNTINVESPSTTPGGAFNFGMTIAPENDLIYQFGSTRVIAAWSNALFRYNINTNQWAWIAGSNAASPSANYGTLNVEAPTNAIPPKTSMAMSYHPASNNLIITGYNQNDLWRFNLTSNMWACIQGTSAANVAPTYGTLGVSASSNTPGNRENAVGIVIPALNTFYFFGGLLFSNSQTLGDLWQYVIGSVPVVVPTSTTTTTISTTTTTTTSTTTTSTTTTTTTSTTTSSTSSTNLNGDPTSLSMSVITGTLSTRSTMSTTLSNFLSTSSSESMIDVTPVVGTTEFINFVPTDSLTTVAPTSTDSTSAPGSTSSSLLLVYAAAGGGGILLLIVTVVALVLVRQKLASKSRKQQGLAPFTRNQMFSQIPPNEAYSTQSFQSPMQLTKLKTEHYMYPTVNSMVLDSMYSQPMSQQSITMGIQSPMSTNRNVGIPRNANWNMDMNSNTSVTQLSTMQPPGLNNGQGALQMILGDYENPPRNHNQF